MRTFLLWLVLGLAVVHSEPAATKTTLSQAATQTLAKVAISLSGTVKAEEDESKDDRGYIVKLKNDKVVFVLSSHRPAVGSKVTALTVYPMGKYNIPFNDEDRSMPKFTDDPGLAADYLMTIGVDYVGQLQPPSSD